MDDSIKEIISKADRGDGAAQKELMDMGQEASGRGDHEQAAYLFKMAAMAYRIAASRSSGVLADTAQTCGRFATTIRYYDEWVKKYTRPLAPRINRLKRHKGNFDRPILSMWREGSEFSRKLRFLEKQLFDRGIEICAPGGTINRHFYYMVRQHDAFKGFRDDIEIRVVLDPICDEVMERLKTEYATEKCPAK